VPPFHQSVYQPWSASGITTIPGKPAAVFTKSPFFGSNQDQYVSPCPWRR
jgi:hypothetical protein